MDLVGLDKRRHFQEKETGDKTPEQDCGANGAALGHYRVLREDVGPDVQRDGEEGIFIARQGEDLAGAVGA